MEVYRYLYIKQTLDSPEESFRSLNQFWWLLYPPVTKTSFIRRFTMKYLFQSVLLLSCFLTALAKPNLNDNVKQHPQCNVNNNFYAGSNSKKIENMLSEVQQQLAKLEQEIRNIKEKQTGTGQDGKGW